MGHPLVCMTDVCFEFLSLVRNKVCPRGHAFSSEQYLKQRVSIAIEIQVRCVQRLDGGLELLFVRTPNRCVFFKHRQHFRSKCPGVQGNGDVTLPLLDANTFKCWLFLFAAAESVNGGHV